ncbi:CBO0543 family protein [Robertmurraya sp. Marseille-Q9965]
MRKSKVEHNILLFLLGFHIVLLIPILLRKPPIKDWMLVYFYNAVTNVFIDNILVSLKIVRYPNRILPKLFHTHVLFDILIYPTISVFYNQITLKDKPMAIFFKIFFFTVPMLLIELWAEKYSNLIKWSSKWKWYHTFLSLTFKSLVTRGFIAGVRKIEERQKQRETGALV